jgi:uncharacterized membrane protein required for colicin V production
MHSTTVATQIPGHVWLNWFDAVVLVVILFGFRSGRKHGMSEELIITLQWIAIVVAGAFLYKPLGDMLAASSPVSHLFCYMAMYVSLAIVTKLVFAGFKKAIGGKLIGSDVFGGGEYYLGMVAGGVRFACMLVAAMALLNAPYYSQADIAAAKAYTMQNYGSNFFPEMFQIQQDVFKDSLVGGLIKQKADILLIASTKSEVVNVQRRKEDLP